MWGRRGVCLVEKKCPLWTDSRNNSARPILKLSLCLSTKAGCKQFKDSTIRSVFAACSLRVAADPEDLLAALGVYGVPTTLAVDRQSREIGRLVTPANWDSKEMIDLRRLKIAP
jgi:hypothetical protein